MKQNLIIPCELPGLNQVIAESKRHWSKYHDLKRKSTSLVACLARRHLQPVRSGRVHLTFKWYCRNKRRDPDNICSAKKFIIDGLVEAGIIPDDSMRYIAGFTDRFEVDKAHPRVEVELQEG